MISRYFMSFQVITIIIMSMTRVYANQIDVEIKNGTENRSIQVDQIKLLEISNAMNVIDSQDNVSGIVTYDNIDVAKSYLIQVVYSDVKYFRLLDKEALIKLFSDSEQKKSKISIVVYEDAKVTTNKPFDKQRLGDTKNRNIDYQVFYTLDYVSMQKMEEDVQISFSVTLNNQSKIANATGQGAVVISYATGLELKLANAIPGSANFSLSYDKLPLHSMVQNKEDDIWLINNPLKPGMTTMVVSYKVSHQNSSVMFPVDVSDSMLYIMPVDAEISLSTPQQNHQIELLKEDTKENFYVYQIDSLAANSLLSVDIKGGSIGASNQTQQSKGRVISEPPAIASYDWLVLTLSLLLIVFIIYKNFALHYVKERDLRQIINEIAQLELEKKQDNQNATNIKNLEKRIKELKKTGAQVLTA